MMIVKLHVHKSVTTLMASSLSFYPVRMCILNVTDETRRYLIVSWRTTVSYLPCTFTTDVAHDNDMMHSSLQSERSSRFS